MTYPRIQLFDSGTAMIVTDLHGEWKAYELLRDTFLQLHQAGKVQRWILCGDLLHGYGKPADDASLPMLLDVMRLQAELGRETVILLMGNHEMPHVYAFNLSKGNLDFTPRFEAALLQLDQQANAPYRRADVIAFLQALPFYVGTQAGVLIAHAGAAPLVRSAQIAADVLNFDHAGLLQWGEDRVQAQYDLVALQHNTRYAEQVEYVLGIQDPQHPRYTDFLRGQVISQTHELFALLWDVLFATCETGGLAGRYCGIATTFLQHLSALLPYEQRVIVAGHITAGKGYTEVCRNHLRIASYAHAEPRHAGKYLLLDCATPVHEARDLIPHLQGTFTPR
jgi:hypothetical protein